MRLEPKGAGGGAECAHLLDRCIHQAFLESRFPHLQSTHVPKAHVICQHSVVRSASG